MSNFLECTLCGKTQADMKVSDIKFNPFNCGFCGGGLREPKTPILTTTDIFLAILRAALEHNSQIVKMAMLYTSNYGSMRPNHQKRIVQQLRETDKIYSDIQEPLIKKLEKQI